MLEEILHKGLKIDKRHWKPVRFGDVVMEPKETAKNLAKEGIEHVVGLDHIDSEDIHLRRSAGIEEATTFTKKFRKGDVLFGRRRAYLKKAAVASFTGICSGDITVLRVKEELLPALLPFLVNNDKFFDYAMKHSAGGLSPRVKFKDLANYEFLLPPKEEQAALAEVLWALDEVIEREKHVLSSMEKYFSRKKSKLIWDANHNYASLVSFAKSEIGKLIDGDWIESKDQSDDGIKLLQLADIGIGEFINKSSRYISEATFKRLRCFEVIPGDILIARMPDPIGRACIVEDIGLKMITAVDCCIVRVDSEQNSKKFLIYLLNSSEFFKVSNMLSSGTTRQRISRKNLEEISVPKPLLIDQLKIVDKLENISNGILNVKEKIFKSKYLLKHLIEKSFDNE